MYNLFVLIFVFNFIYEDSDSLVVYDDSLTMAGYHSYNIKIHLRNAHIAITPWSGASDSTGWLTLESPSIVCCLQTVIRGSGAGYWGGLSGHGDGYGPGAGEVGGISGGGGGGAGYGGAGGDGGDYYPGSGGSTYGNPSDTIVEIGSGGGAGQYVSVIDGYGGKGGAMVRVRGQNIAIDSADIVVNGFPGESGSIGFEGGGGGSGGSILILSDTISLHYTSLSACGNDGAGSEYGGGGGAGGGRIKVLYMVQLDTLEFLASAAGGAGGIGYQGSNGTAGSNGSVYIAPLVGLKEYAQPANLLTSVNNTIVMNSLLLRCDQVPATLHIYDATGRLIHVSTLMNTVSTVPIHRLKNGVYFLSLDYCPTQRIKIVVIR